MIPQTKKKLSAGEKLLRNSAIACALLLGILSLRNIEHPWAQTASNVVEKALTVDFDVDETLGELQFVQRFLPESAMVFWNIPKPDKLIAPVKGAMLHEWTSAQPWYSFIASQGEEVLCGKSGTLEDAKQTKAGDWVLTIRHADGSSMVYAFVDRGTIDIGEVVQSGEALAHATMQGCVYVEFRKDEESKPVEEFVG